MPPMPEHQYAPASKEPGRIYLCIDLKSFYASVECVERGLDPMTVNLVVADPTRTERTICLAVTPAMKKLGVRNRCRVYEIPRDIPYIMAPPRMHLYLEYSAKIYGIYLRYIAIEDIHVYSVDEAFLDVTDYLRMYHMDARSLGLRIMEDIFQTTGISSSCGVGTNLYLTKVALDITAKHAPDRVGMLDEAAYRKTMWDHRPLTDFWRIGPGTASRLYADGLTTMRQVAGADEDLLYRRFGIDAELLIDHAWGREPTTIADIKSYRPKSNSLTSGQVLPRNYHFADGLLLVKEMADLLCLDMSRRDLVTDSVTLYVGCTADCVQRRAHGTAQVGRPTCLERFVLPCVEQLYRRVVSPDAVIRRVGLCFNHVEHEEYTQFSLFDDPAQLEKERSLQKTVAALRERFGNNAVIKGMDLAEGARTVERNGEIGGHRA